MKTRKVWHHLSDIRLDRSDVRGKGVIRVYDADGDMAFDLPASLSDKDVEMVLEVINRGFNLGYEIGKAARSRELRELLDIQNKDWEKDTDG